MVYWQEPGSRVMVAKEEGGGMTLQDRFDAEEGHLGI